MADYTQLTGPLKFPRVPGDDYIDPLDTLQDGDTLLYTETQVRYVYDATSGTWTGATGDLNGIEGFPEIPGSFPGKDGQYFVDGDLQISKDEIDWDTNPINSTPSDTIYVRWNPTSLNQAHKTLIEGSVKYVAFGATLAQSFAAYNLLRVPTNEMSAAIGNTSYNSDIQFPLELPKGYGTIGETTFVYIESTDSSSVKLETSAGGSTTAVGTKLEMEKGDTFTVTHQSSGTTSTTTTTKVFFTDNIETTSGVPYDGGIFISETTNVTPSIQTPTILTPVDGAIGVDPEAGITSSAYVGLNGAGPHTSSTWEVYADGYPLTSTNTITSVTTSGTGSWTVITDDVLINSYTIASSNGFRDVKYGNGIYMAIGDKVTITSTDGINWTSVGGIVDTVVCLAYGNGVWIATGVGGILHYSTNDGVSWTRRDIPSAYYIWDADFDEVNGRFVLAGQRTSTGSTSHTVYSTDDPINGTWDFKTPVSLGDTGAGNRTIVCGGGISVFGTAKGYAAWSDDGGLTWTNITNPGWGTSPSDLFHGAYSPEVQQFLMWNNAKWFMSPDGENWTNTLSSLNAVDVDWDPHSSKFIVRSNGGAFLSVDTDGATYTNEGTFPDSGPTNFTAGVAAGGPNRVILARDGTTNPSNPRGYYSASPSTTISIAGAQTDGFIVSDVIDNCGGSDEAIIYSLDDTQVIVGGSPSGFNVGDNICRGSSSYAEVINAVDDTSNLTSFNTTGQLSNSKDYYARVQYKDNGSTESEFSSWSEFQTASDPSDWTSIIAPLGPWFGINTGNGMWAAVGLGTNNIITSTDGFKWSYSTPNLPCNNANKCIAYGAGVWVSFNSGCTNRGSYSTDNMSTWTEFSAGANVNWNEVIFENNQFVAVGSRGGANYTNVFVSTDGLVWDDYRPEFASGQAGDWAGVAYGDGKWVIVDNSTGVSIVMHSTDGRNYGAGFNAENNAWQGVAYGGDRFVAVASTGTNRVMYSLDGGANWTNVPAAEDNEWMDVAYGNGYFVAVAKSGTNRVMYSKDGINWTTAAASENNEWYRVAFQDNMFIACSVDGTNRLMYTMV